MHMGGPSGSGDLINFSGFFANRRANQAESAVQRTEVLLRQLEERVDKLTLVNMALWSLLKEQVPALTDQQLLDRIQEVDLSDGQLDGRVRNQIRDCPQCGRTLSARHHRCLYCDFTPEENPVFGGLGASPVQPDLTTNPPLANER